MRLKELEAGIEKEKEEIELLQQLSKDIEQELIDKSETEKRLNEAIEDIGQELEN